MTRTPCRLRECALALLMLCQLTPALGAEQRRDSAPPSPTAEKPHTQAGASDAKAQPDEPEPISMTVSDAKIQDVLQLLAAMRPDVNIIMGTGVEGTVPLLSIQDSDLEEALNLLAESCNLRIAKEGKNTYRVETVVELPPGALQIDLLKPNTVDDLLIDIVRRLVPKPADGRAMTDSERRAFLRENASKYIRRLSVTKASPVEVVNELARKGELNFAFNPGIPRARGAPEGGARAGEAPERQYPRLTLNLRYLSVVEALKMVSSQGGLSCTFQNGVWVVSPLPPQKLQVEPLELAMFDLKFIPIDDELLQMCQSLVTERGSVARGKNRVLVVRDVADGIETVRTAVEVMDRPTPQVLIEARFFELSDSFDKHLGVEWNTLGTDGLSISTGPYTINETGTRAEQEAWQNSTREMTTTTTDTTTTDRQTGAITGAVAKQITETVRDPSKTSDSVQETMSRTVESAILDTGQLTAILHALKSSEGAKQLSNPKVVVSSEEQATIHIGDQTPILKSSTEGEAGVKSYELDGDFGGQTVEAVDLIGEDGESSMRTYTTPKGYLDLGTKLTVAPSVKTDEKVYIKVMPELVTLTGYEVTASGDRYPQLFSTRVDTQFTIKSGQTIAIGGLVNERDRTSQSKVPVLGSVPLLGRAFRYDSTTRTKSETIIFLTVKIIPSEEMMTTSGIPISAHMVQPEVERIRLEDSAGAEYDEQRAKKRLRETMEDAERQDWSPAKFRRKLQGIFSDESATADGAKALDAPAPSGETEDSQRSTPPAETGSSSETDAPESSAPFSPPVSPTPNQEESGS